MSGPGTNSSMYNIDPIAYITLGLIIWEVLNVILLIISLFFINTLVKAQGKTISCHLYQRAYYFHQFATTFACLYEIGYLLYERNDDAEKNYPAFHFFAGPLLRSLHCACYIMGTWYSAWAPLAEVKDGLFYEYTLRARLKWLKRTPVVFFIPLFILLALFCFHVKNTIIIPTLYGLIIHFFCFEITCGVIFEMRKAKHPMIKILKVLRYKPTLLFKAISVYNGIVKLITASVLFALFFLFGWEMDAWLCIFPTGLVLLSRMIWVQSLHGNVWSPLFLAFKKRFLSPEVQPEIIISYDANSDCDTPRVNIRLPNGSINTNITIIPDQTLAVNIDPVIEGGVIGEPDVPVSQPIPPSVDHLDDQVSQISERELARDPSPPPVQRKNFIQVKRAKDYRDYSYNPKC